MNNLLLPELIPKKPEIITSVYKIVEQSLRRQVELNKTTFNKRPFYRYRHILN